VRRARAFRATALAFTISKVSTVKVSVWGARGLSLSRDLQLPRGRHSLSWRPPGRGRYRLRIEARGPSGPAGVAVATIRVTHPKPKPKPRHKKRRHAKKKTRDGPTAAVARQPIQSTAPGA
jgi:hypothetical protein